MLAVARQCISTSVLTPGLQTLELLALGLGAHAALAPPIAFYLQRVPGRKARARRAAGALTLNALQSDN